MSATEHEEEVLAIGYPGGVEVQRMCGILVNELVLRLRCAHAVVVNLMVFVGVGELLAFFGARVCAIVETVALPLGIGEFCPFDVVGEELLGLGVHHVDFGPVGAVARDGVCGVATVVALGCSCQRHGAVVGEVVGVEEQFGLATDGVCAV